MSMVMEEPITPSAPVDLSGPTNAARKSKLLGRLQEGAINLDILGYCCWWNVREVRLTRDEFSTYLKEVGLDDKYARSHNYRSALIRALKSMEEDRLIRRVQENETYVIFQFTGEKLIRESEETAHLEYTAEVTVTVDKEAYGMFARDEDGFFKSIVSVKDPSTGEEAPTAMAIKIAIAKAFEHEKDAYKSSDITRYVQRIFEDKADIISLRPQGSIYFVPAAYQSIVDSVKGLMGKIGGMCTFESIPMVDTKDARKAIGDSFAEEVVDLLKGMDEEIKKMDSGGKSISEKWVETRKDRINKIKERIDTYAEVLGDKARALHGDFDALAAILKPRVIVLD